MKKVLLLGSNGGIGSAIKTILEKDYQVIETTRDNLDLASPFVEDALYRRLSLIDPDFIVNAAGHFGTNQESHHQTMSVNFGSNWSVVKFYLDRCKTLDRDVKIIMIGSSAHKTGKKDYMLYSASKAALFNLWQGARDSFQGSRVTIDIINPVRTCTGMAPGVPQPGWLDPQDVAAAVLARMTVGASECIDMNYKD